MDYRGFIIFPTSPQPPIPIRAFDWSWVIAEQADDGPDIDPECTGFGRTAQDCRTAVDEYWAEQEIS